MVALVWLIFFLFDVLCPDNPSHVYLAVGRVQSSSLWGHEGKSPVCRVQLKWLHITLQFDSIQTCDGGHCLEYRVLLCHVEVRLSWTHSSQVWVLIASPLWSGAMEMGLRWVMEREMVRMVCVVV